MDGTSDGCVSLSGALLLLSRAFAWPARGFRLFPIVQDFFFSGFKGYGELLAHLLAESVIYHILYTKKP